MPVNTLGHGCEQISNGKLAMCTKALCVVWQLVWFIREHYERRILFGIIWYQVDALMYVTQTTVIYMSTLLTFISHLGQWSPSSKCFPMPIGRHEERATFWLLTSSPQCVRDALNDDFAAVSWRIQTIRATVSNVPWFENKCFEPTCIISTLRC